MRGWTLIFFNRIYIFHHYIRIYIWNSVFLIYFFYCFPIYLFIYLFRAAKFMHNINIIHRSFSPTTLFPCLAGCLTFSLPCPAYFLALPYFLASPVAFPFPCLALPVSLPCLFPLPSACFFSLPTSVACLFPCPPYFRVLPIGLLFCMSARCTGNMASIYIFVCLFQNIIFDLQVYCFTVV